MADKLTDDEILADVRAVLQAEVADVTASPTLLADVHRAQARRRTVGWLWAVPVAAAVAAVAVVVALLPGGTPTTPVTPPLLPEPANAATVRERTSTALDSVLDSVIYERGTVAEGEKYFPPDKEGLSERWLAADGSSFRYRASVDGTTIVDMSRDRVSDVFVDYRTRTYRAAPGMASPAPEYDDVWTPTEIKDAIDKGRIRVLGPGDLVNGKPTVRLRLAESTASPATDFWVDTVTYLPVRWQWRQSNPTLFDVAWLPPTPENLAQLTTVIPPDFREE
jgi:hypothetical protein